MCTGTGRSWRIIRRPCGDRITTTTTNNNNNNSNTTNNNDNNNSHNDNNDNDDNNNDNHTDNMRASSPAAPRTRIHMRTTSCQTKNL